MPRLTSEKQSRHVYYYSLIPGDGFPFTNTRDVPFLPTLNERRTLYGSAWQSQLLRDTHPSLLTMFSFLSTRCLFVCLKGKNFVCT